MRVALVHDWITGLRGGERCLQAFLNLYPDADIFTLLHVPGSTTPAIDARVKATSYIGDLPYAKRIYRHLLPLYPLAVSRADLGGKLARCDRENPYDLVISLSHAAVKNISVPQGRTHLVYCFTPMRYIWDQQKEYFGALTTPLSPILGGLRWWDRRSSVNPAGFVGISRFISARIRCYYGRQSEVIHPPVETSWITPLTDHRQGEAFLYAGALVPYKKADVAIDACNRLGVPLWIAGSGPEEEHLRRIAGPTVKFLGRVSDQELGELYGRCRALLFPGVEDFGIIPVECMAAGRPVIGCGAGGLIDTVIGPTVRAHGPRQQFQSWAGRATGLFFPRQKSREGEVSGLESAMRSFIEHEEIFTPRICQAQAKPFGVDRFNREWNSYVERFVSAELVASNE